MKTMVQCLGFGKGPGVRTLAEFEDGEPALNHTSAKAQAMDWVEDVLKAVDDESLFKKLEEVAAACNAMLPPPTEMFTSVYDVPLCIVNMALSPWNIWIEEGDAP